MADIQIAVIDEKDTQIALAVPGIQGPAGAISSGGSANQVFYKVSGTNYDAGWTFIGNANVDAAAAIAGTKISPNFGSQATVTTGTNTAASFIPTSATIPSNGIYLPGANQVGVATNGTPRLSIDASGNVAVDTNTLYVDAVNNRVGIGITGPQAPLHVRATAGAANDRGILIQDTTAGTTGEAWLSFKTQESTDEERVKGAIVYANAGSAYGRGNLLFLLDSVDDNGSVTTSDEKMRITYDGKLLVGTTTTQNIGSSVGARIEASEVGANFVTCSLRRHNSLNITGPLLNFGRSRGTTEASATIVQNNDELGAIQFAGADDVDIQTIGALIGAYVDGAPGADNLPTRLVFSTNPGSPATGPTERMRITSSGAILLGCTSAPNPGSASTSSGFAINGTGNDAYVTQKQDNAPLGYLRRDGTDGAIYEFRKGDSAVGSISVTASATAFNTSSDYRLKQNVTAVTGSITRLQQLKPSRFNFIADPGKTVDGFIAHEVQDVVPEAIYGTKDEVDADGNPVYQGIDQSKLVPLLTAALQEAVAEIKALKDRVTALEAA